jgi:hypothetical protein
MVAEDPAVSERRALPAVFLGMKNREWEFAQALE